MGSAIRTKQGGSILVYIIIGAVLAAAVVGTIFFVRQRGEQTQRQTPLFTAPTTAPEPQPSKPNTSDKSSPSTDQKPQSPVVPAPHPGSTAAPPAQVPQTATLPRTGPAETATSFVILALLTGFTVAYVQSRRSFALQRS